MLLLRRSGQWAGGRASRRLAKELAHNGPGVMAQVKPPLEKPTFHIRVLAGAMSTLLLIQPQPNALRKAANKAWKVAQSWRPYHPIGRPKRSSLSLASNRLSSDLYSCSGSELADGRSLYLCVSSLCNCLSNESKINILKIKCFLGGRNIENGVKELWVC